MATEALLQDNLSRDPIAQFNQWFAQAQASESTEATAAVLSTVDHENHPDSRVILLKAVSAGQFIFYTNYDSEKCGQLAKNPYAALNFLWPNSMRQVRIRGEVSKVSAEASRAYFSKRPYMSCVGAHASPQSQEIENREVLMERVTQTIKKYPKGEDIPCPENWGGLQLKPFAIEFWQAGDYRLHDRFSYTWNPSTLQWDITRLAP